MKKLLVISTLLGISILFFGCSKKDKTDTVDTTIISDTETSHEICSSNSGVLTNREEGGVTVCLFDDETFCFLEDLENGDCEKGFLPLYDKEVDNSKAEESTYDDCNKTEQNIVCGKDGNTYFNKCYLEAAGIEEETELAQVENGECIFEKSI